MYATQLLPHVTLLQGKNNASEFSISSSQIRYIYIKSIYYITTL
ncbi:ABC transporter transmembrane region [Musa troglodytarum]|uniref:ABC transporter transmembrane region n=1 Tax=Musa troglodytarum TaxID=320322 RepID=A0A9E7FV77_9LILI|nr:ABC transporter transmembrane region [Musa troglodytarum]